MGAFHVVRPAFPVMCKAGYGRIVLTSSIGGLYGTHNVVNYGVSKAGMIGLNNIVAIEGAAKGVKCNIIAPGAVTRMADGLDISQYPPMGPELVAPVVGWLAHESCSITGEMLISMAGRVARALIAETEGVYRPSWTIDEVARSDRRHPRYRQAVDTPAGSFRLCRSSGTQLRYGAEGADRGGASRRHSRVTAALGHSYDKTEFSR